MTESDARTLREQQIRKELNAERHRFGILGPLSRTWLDHVEYLCDQLQAERRARAALEQALGLAASIADCLIARGDLAADDHKRLIVQRRNWRALLHGAGEGTTP